MNDTSDWIIWGVAIQIPIEIKVISCLVKIDICPVCGREVNMRENTIANASTSEYYHPECFWVKHFQKEGKS